MTVYKCYYIFLGSRMTATANSLAELKDGFWVDQYHRYTHGADAKVWIAPASISYIEKVTLS